jgi:uncharacterized protein (TIGR00255 family)
MRSMTGYGFADCQIELGSITLELTSVNRKHLEISMQLPRLLQRFEIKLRKILTSTIKRGSVSARYFLYSSPNAETMQTQYLAHAAESWKKIAQNIGCDPKEITVPFLVEEMQKNIHLSENQCKKTEEELLIMTLKALEQLLQTRDKEGKRSKKIFLQDLILLAKHSRKLKNVRLILLQRQRKS